MQAPFHCFEEHAMHAFQDYYPENVAHCYGCGRLNEHGHHI